MTAVLQWTALGVCLACLAWRFPSAIKGRNTSLFWCFVLISVALGLSISSIYLPVDGLLGGTNVANLILHLCVDVLFFILAGKVASAYRSPAAVRLIRGLPGQAVLAVMIAATVAAFWSGDHPRSSTGLDAYGEQPAIELYGHVNLVFPAYAAACLVWPTFRAALRARRVLDRASALLLSLGFALVVASLIGRLLPMREAWDVYGLPFAAVLCVAIGLALVWISSVRALRRAS